MALPERECWWRRWAVGWCALVVCVLVAALYRVALVATHHDVPGDGPSRSVIAIVWTFAPDVPRCGGWPPGWTFLAGSFSLLLDAPLWSSRVLNVMLGVLSVPLAWSIAARTWGSVVALPVGLALALLPLHAELSATSLTEVSFVFLLLLGWHLLLAAATTPSVRVRAATLVAGGIAVSFAQMVRYEGWVLAPPLLVWWLVCRGRSRALAVLAVLLLWFPLAWLAGNASCGDAIQGLRASVSEPSAGDGYGLGAAVAHLATLARTELGLPVALALLAGGALEIVALARGRCSSARLLALFLAGTAWVFLVRFTMSRGPSAWNRYALMTLVVSLGFAFVPLRLLPRTPRGGRVAVVATGFLLLAMLVPDLSGARARHWLRRSPPVEAEQFVRWLDRWGDHARVPMLSTPVGWELTYLGLLRPEVAPRLCTISSWISDPDLRGAIERLRGHGPFLLITRYGDEVDLARIEHFAGSRLAEGRPVYETAGLRVYVADIPGG